MNKKLFTLLFATWAGTCFLWADIFYETLSSDGLTYQFDSETKTAVIYDDGLRTHDSNWVSREKILWNDIWYTVTSVGEAAFYESPVLESVTFSNVMKSIGMQAFAGCEKLKSVHLGPSVFFIGPDAFMRSGIKSVTVPSQISTIKSGAFCYCKSLTSATVNSDYIGEHMFLFCTNLNNVHIGSNVKYIGAYAFDNCQSLTSIDIPNNVITIHESAFYQCKALNTAIIHSSKIDNSAFGYCDNLETIELGDEVTTIGDFAFSRCYHLNTLTLPSSLTHIGKYAFESAGITSITIPEGITSLEESTFSECVNLKSIELPRSLINIGTSVFRNCNFTEVIIPENVVSIGDGAFNGCRSLKSIELPLSLDSIGGAAFMGDTSLTDVIIPENVKRIGSYAFNCCLYSYEDETYVPHSNLKSMTCMAVTPPKLGENVFEGLECAKIPMYVPKKSISAYKTAEQWKEFHPIMAIEDVPDDIEKVQKDKEQSMKVIRNGQTYIFRGEKIYTMQGQEVK